MSIASRTAIVVVAAGQGERLGAGMPKALAPVAGEPLLAHALRTVVDPDLAARVVVVTPPGDQRLDAVARDAAVDGVEIVVVPGGLTRQASVSAGLAHAGDAQWVLVHDAARALAPKALFQRVESALESGAVAAIPGLPVVDTLKRVDAGEHVVQTPDRSELRAVQTPQGFDAALLRQAHQRDTAGTATDDAALMEAAGAAVTVVPGEDTAFKITHAPDIERAERLLGLPASPAAPTVVVPRIGIGYDVHAFSTDPDTPLWLAGLHFPGETGLSGHSDGDAVAHAACDALFTAAGIGDLGVHFGTSRPEYAGASGTRLLAEAGRLVREAGFEIGNVAVQFVGQRPRFSARRLEADAVLTQALGAPVSVSATTSDGLGFEGAREGISARAVALVHPR